MNKRGQALPLATVIIAILVVLVLVLVIVIFLGGMRGVSEKIRGTWKESISGTDITLAIKSCENYCEQARNLPESLRKKSAYCKNTFYLDLDNDREAEYYMEGDVKKYTNFYCYGSDLNIVCEGVSGSVCLESAYISGETQSYTEREQT